MTSSEINSQNMFLADIKITNRKRPADPETVASIAGSMAELGLLQAIGVTEDNELVFGFHRYEAARKLGWKTIRVFRTQTTGKLQARRVQLAENLFRNDLDVWQRAKWLREYEDVQEQLGKRAKSGAGKRGAEDERGETVSPLTVAQRAAEIGMGERSFQQHLQIANGIDPEVGDDLAEVIGEKTTQLLQLAKMPLEDQQHVRDLIATGQARDVREASRLMRREQLGSRPIPTGQFDLLVADPPWNYGNDGARGSAENHYPTMTIDELLALPIAEQVAKEAVLFLWTTTQHQSEALLLLDHWGFTYKSEIIWAKPRIGTGFYVRGKHEKLWICTKGDRLLPAWLPESVQSWPVSEHSRKPAEAYDMIERMYPHLTARLELFGRQAREGWQVHGNESEKFDEAAPLLEQEPQAVAS